MAQTAPVALLHALLATAGATVPDEALDAVVLLQQGGSTCAGTLVEGGRAVVTAYHCVAPGGRPRVTTRDGASTVARIHAVDVALDLAVLDTPELEGQPVLELSLTPAAPGDEVWALGHPLAVDVPSGFYEGTLRWAASDGIVAAVGPRTVQVTAAVNPGNSGGPIVDTEGHLLAVVSRRLGGEGIGFAGRSEALRALLDREPRGLSPLGGTLAVETMLTSHGDPEGGLAVGGRVELALRDRVVLDGAVSAPLSARWNAARFGSFEHARADVRAGLRQRFGRGPFTTTLDLVGGLAALERIEAAPDDALELSTTTTAIPLVAGTVRLRSIGLELGWYPTDGSSRAVVILRLPGVLTVF